MRWSTEGERVQLNRKFFYVLHENEASEDTAGHHRQREEAGEL